MPTNQLSPAQAEQVLDLAAVATAHDGVDPLNEEARFALRDDSAEHYLHHVGDRLAGYLIWLPLHHTGQLVVHPEFRRQGIGRTLVEQAFGVIDGAPAGSTTRPVAIWAFGHLRAAQGFASALELSPVRGLLIMDRPLAEPVTPHVPDALQLRGFELADAAAVLTVNAAAFAHHPEQGSLDEAGLHARMAEPWFDPSGLILGFDADGLAGFHWTKRMDARTGEVYVMAVAPRAQGRGYGKALLNAGLAHLQRSGCDRVLLYVDMADQVAVRMYESAGFRVTHRDVLLAPKPKEQQ